MPPLAVRVQLVPILAEAPVVVTDIEPPAVEVPIVRAPAFVMVAEPVELMVKFGVIVLMVKLPEIASNDIDVVPVRVPNP